MSRLRHEKGVRASAAGAGSGVHRLEASKPLPFKHDEELKHGGKAHRVHGGSRGKLARKRGGACHSKGGHVTHDGKPSPRGTDATPDRGMKFGTKVHEDKMSGLRTITGGSSKPPSVEDSLKHGGHAHHADGGQVKWIQKAHIKKGAETAAAKRAGMGVHEYMEKHKHDSGKAGRRARLGLTLSAMAKHKKHGD